MPTWITNPRFCLQCGAEITYARSHRKQKFCNRECHSKNQYAERFKRYSIIQNHNVIPIDPLSKFDHYDDILGRL